MEKELRKKTPKELQEILKKINEKTKKNIEIPKGKKELISIITKIFQEYSERQEKKEGRFCKLKQLGEKGRECKAFLVADSKKGEYAMKTYRKNKPINLIRQEYEFQKLAEKEGISPKLIDVDFVNKSMTMEKMDRDILDVIYAQKGVLKRAQQLRIIEIFKTLDKIGVFHMDANPPNFMEKNGQIYIIDYGFSKPINSRLINKFGTKTPNLDYMTISFIIQLKEAYPDINLKYMEKYISGNAAKRIQLKAI
jgi:tRNA A-37 threonylcarbamoyl transferase component Bud32